MSLVSGCAFGLVGRSQVGGICVALLRRPRFVFSDALSAGDAVFQAAPAGSLTAKVFYNGGSIQWNCPI